jgi:hypothetical protein
MKMPAVIDVWYEIPSYAKRMSGFPGNFKQLRSHDGSFFIKEFLQYSNVKLKKIVCITGSDLIIYLRKRLHEEAMDAFWGYYNVFVNKIRRRDRIL